MLVPVRRGGPWSEGGSKWEWWQDGKFNGCTDTGVYQCHEGEIEYTFRGSRCYPCGVGPEGAEFRAPKDWTGPMPEGCCPAVGFIKGQRVRAKADSHLVLLPVSLVLGVRGLAVDVVFPMEGNYVTVNASCIEGY